MIGCGFPSGGDDAKHVPHPPHSFSLFTWDAIRQPRPQSRAQGKRSGLRGAVAVVGWAVPMKQGKTVSTSYPHQRSVHHGRISRQILRP